MFFSRLLDMSVSIQSADHLQVSDLQIFNYNKNLLNSIKHNIHMLLVLKKDFVKLCQ